MNTTARVTYAIGHRLLGHDGLCANLHGHNYTFEVTVTGNVNNIGYVVDFSVLKKHMRAFLDKFDHAMVLNSEDPALDYLKGSGDRLVIMSKNPSAEHFASLLFNHIQDLQFSVKEVRVQESDGGWATADRVDRTITVKGFTS